MKLMGRGEVDSIVQSSKSAFDKAKLEEMKAEIEANREMPEWRKKLLLKELNLKVKRDATAMAKRDLNDVMKGMN